MGYILNLTSKPDPGSEEPDACKVCDCADDPCDSCDCPVPTLKGDSREASKSKCGFLNEEDGKYYLKRSIKNSSASLLDDWNVTQQCGCGCYNNGNCCSDVILSGSLSTNDPQLDEFPENCTPPVSTRTQEARYVLNATITYGPCYPRAGMPDACPPSGTPGDGCPENSPQVLDPLEGGLIYPEDPVYENEYATEALITNTESALGSFPDAWTGSPISSRYVPEDESSCTLEEGRGKLTVDEPMPDNLRLKAQVKRVVTLDEGGETTTILDITIEPGETESDIIDNPIPDSNGTSELILDEESVECEVVE